MYHLQLLISALTFPGVIIHELAHQLYCRWLKVAVFKVVYFQMEEERMGYVAHERPQTVFQSAMISYGPFSINTLLGFLIAFPAAIQLKLGGHMGFVNYAMLYLGISIAMHAFPSVGDARALKDQVNALKSPWHVKAIVLALNGLVFIGAYGSRFGLNVAYGLGIAIGLPWLILSCYV